MKLLDDMPKKTRKDQQRPLEAPEKRQRQKKAHAWLVRTFAMGRPSVIQSDSEGFYFQFGDSPDIYKLLWEQMQRHEYPDLRAARIS